MEEKVETSTVSVINEALGQNEFLKEYQNLISITAKIQDKGEPLADAYTYILAIEAVDLQPRLGIPIQKLNLSGCNKKSLYRS